MKMRLFRVLCLTLALCLLSSGALAEVVLAVPGSVLADDEESKIVESPNTVPEVLFVQNDTLYAQTWNELYRAVEGGWERVMSAAYEEGSIALTAGGDEGVYFLLRRDSYYDEATESFIYPEQMFSLFLLPVDESSNIGELEQVCKVTWEVNEENWPQFYGMVVMNGAAYILLYDDGEWQNHSLYRVDLATGEGKLVLTDCITGMIAYKDGLLLARRFSWDGAYDEKGHLVNPPEIVSIDPTTGETAVLGHLPDTGYGALAYDAATDTLYYSGSTFVYRCDSSFAGEPVGYLMAGNTSRSELPAAIYHDRYYTGDWREDSGMVSATVDPSLLPTRTLRLGNSWYVEDIIRQFAKEHPDVAVEYVDVPGGTAEDYRNHMESPLAADIYSLSLPYSVYAPLLKYGLLQDLSSSDTLVDLVSRMYPNLTDEYFKDGKLYGLPVSIYASTMGYYADALEKVGMTEEDLPSTYDELLDFVVNWYYDYFDDYEEIQLFEWSPELRMSFFQMIFSTQVLVCEAKGERITFRTPTIQRLLNRLDSPEIKNVFDALSPQRDESGVMVFAYDGSPSAIFTSSNDPMPSMHQRWRPAEPLMLRLDEDADPVIQASVSLMTVNRASKNQELAIELLEYISERLPQDIMTALLPDVNEPIQMAYYEENIAFYREQVALMEAQLEDVPEEERGDYEEAIQWWRDRIVHIEEEERWAFTEEDIAYYREHVAPNLVVSASSIFTGEENPATTAMQLYIDGARSADFFISEIDRIVTMMQEENR